MDIDIPLANSAAPEPMFTPGGKRKRADVQADEEDDSFSGGMDMNGQSSGMMGMLGRGNGTGVMMSGTMDEGSAAKQLRTTYTPSNPDPNYNPSADSSTAFPFPFPRLTPTLTPGGGSVPSTPGLLGMMTPGSGQGLNSGQSQVGQGQGFTVGQGAAGMTGMAGDVFGSGSAGGAGSGSYASMNGQDYFSRNSINPQQTSSSSTLAPAPNALRATSPINIQPFTVDLFPPSRPIGLMQPTTSSSNIHQHQGTEGTNSGSVGGSRVGSVAAGTLMGDDSMMQGQGDVDMSESAGTAGMEGMDKVDLAAEIEKARNVHGPQCKTIPKLRLSDHPDPVTGKRSMWAMCSSCGSVEMVPPTD